MLVVKDGLVPNTNAPLPVSSDITPANCKLVVAANCASVPPVYATVPPLPNATDELSVPVNVNVLLAVNVFPSAIVNVEPVAGAVNVTLLMLVADATPRVGVTSVGLVARTFAPVPVTLEKPTNSAFQPAAPLPAVRSIEIHDATVPGRTVITVAALAALTSILPVELLTIRNSIPNVIDCGAGKDSTCVLVPVKNCTRLLFTVNIVVPAAVAVVL